MTLAELNKNQMSRVKCFNGSGAALERLQCLGLLPGVEAQVLRAAPLGDPLQVRVDGTLLSIRIADAKKIDVEAL